MNVVYRPALSSKNTVDFQAERQRKTEAIYLLRYYNKLKHLGTPYPLPPGCLGTTRVEEASQMTYTPFSRYDGEPHTAVTVPVEAFTE